MSEQKKNLADEFGAMIAELDEAMFEALHKAVQAKRGNPEEATRLARIAELEAQLARVGELPYTRRNVESIALKRQIADLHNKK